MPQPLLLHEPGRPESAVLITVVTITERSWSVKGRSDPIITCNCRNSTRRIENVSRLPHPGALKAPNLITVLGNGPFLPHGLNLKQRVEVLVDAAVEFLVDKRPEHEIVAARLQEPRGKQPV